MNPTISLGKGRRARDVMSFKAAGSTRAYSKLNLNDSELALAEVNITMPRGRGAVTSRDKAP